LKKNIAYIEEIEVSSSARKNGIGKKLIDTFRNNFLEFDLTLRVENNNENAINFYLKLGFEKVEIKNNFILMKLKK
jgi:ribosomal protein S18 acetylase RimI-like enzyme